MLSNIDKTQTIELLYQSLNAVGFPAPGPISEPIRMWQSRGGVMVSILEPGVRAFEELTNLVEQSGRVNGRAINDVFSRKYVEGMIQELIAQLVVIAAESGQEPSQLNADQIREVLSEWLGGFEIPSEVATYYTVVGNLVVEAPMQVGTVTLSPVNEETREVLLSECSRIIDAGTDSEEAKERMKQRIAEAFQVGPRRVVAQAVVSEAEPHRAQEIFQERVREVLHVLRFFGHFIYPPSRHVVIDLAGHVYSGRNVFLRLVPDRQIKLAVQRARDPLTYELTGERLEHLKNIGLALVGDILSKEEDERTPLENSCINAITWISRGLQDDVADSRFLKLCIAMESLLLRRNDQPYRQVMAERVAFLLGQDLEKRQRLVRDVKKMYDVRSDIAHEGRSRNLEDQLGPADFYAAYTVLRFIRLMVEEGWHSEDDFISWLDNLKFASP